MTTVINTPAAGDSGASAGWAVAVVVLVAALLVGLFIWPAWIRPAATQPTTTPNINVTVPAAEIPAAPAQ